MDLDDRSAAGPPQRGGVLLRYAEAEGGGSALAFVPAEIALRITKLGSFTRVPGMVFPALGIALADGEIVTVLTLGGETHAGNAHEEYEPGMDWPMPGHDHAVLCHLGALRVALVGATIAATGLFDAYERPAARGESGFPASSIVWRGKLVRVLDVRALYAQAEAAILEERATTSRAMGGGR